MSEPASEVDKNSAVKELEAIQASRILDRAPNLGILLNYVCQKVFEGKAEEIKEYNIAVEAFGRPPEFDKRRDSIVRVEAHRLRKRLIQYYEQEDGRNHKVRVDLPPGQYVPTFTRRGNGQPAPVLPGKPRFRPSMFWAAGAALALSAAAGGAFLHLRHDGTAAKAVPTPGASTSLTAGSAAFGEPIRILAGSTVRSFTDAYGAGWAGDRYFTGGSAVNVQYRGIARTRESTIYLKGREGDFRYDIPLQPGVYEMRLHFAEAFYGEGNIEGGGETSRLFRVFANDRLLLDFFDVVSDAGGANTADVKVFKDIEPASDGYLHVRFVSQKAFAFVNAIEIVPGVRGKLLPIRLLARATGYTDSSGQVWSPDSYYFGGRTVLRQEEVTQTPDPGLYQSERYGNFSYAIPVAPGSYTLNLYFAETWHGPGRPDAGGVGSRLFDMSCNRNVLLRDFDIFSEAKGGYRALKKTFTGLRPNAQGKLLLAFVPTRNYACVNAIEVLDEGR